MKTHILPVLSFALLLLMVSCHKSHSEDHSGTILKIGDKMAYSNNAIDLYDSSTHILYFMSNHAEFDTIIKSPFAFYADNVKIYQGGFWPVYLSSLPATPYISTAPYFYPNYVLRIAFLNPGLNKTDPRNDDRLLSTLKNNNLLHAGLSVAISNIVITDRIHITLSFVVQNHDRSDLLILDYDKMGARLFHYFTNGLYFANRERTQFYENNIEPQVPSPYDSWKIEWLSLLKSGATKQFTINYTLDTPLVSGNYVTYFNFPGLSNQVSRDQLIQNNGRIWLGDVECSRNILVP